MKSKRVTIKDIAKEADCHYSLVSLALRPETAERVSEATRLRIKAVCDRLQYVPDYAARQLVNQDSNTLVFALPFFAEMVASEPFAKMISGVMSGAAAHDLDLHFLIPKEGRMDAHSRELLFGKRIAGIVTAAPDANQEFFNELKQLQVPIVVICTYDAQHGTHHVYCDNEAAAYQAVSYLAKCGHKQIAMIKGPNQSCDGNARFRGYLKALKDHQIKLNENAIIGSELFSSEYGYKTTKDLFSRFERPTAIFCANDDLAIGCLKALKDMNIRCPEEVSVVGFDNIAIAEYTHPPLTTVEQPFFQMAKQAVELLSDLVAAESTSQPVDRCIDARFVLRESVRKI